MSIFERLSRLNLNDDITVVFEYSDGKDVFHSRDDYIEEVVESTNTVSALSEVLTTAGSVFTTEWGGDIIEEMRDDDLLKEYDRGSFTFMGYVKNIITENFYEYEWIDTDTEHYDYKRGYTTVTARLQARYGEIKKLTQDVTGVFTGWVAVVRTGHGTLTIED